MRIAKNPQLAWTGFGGGRSMEFSTEKRNLKREFLFHDDVHPVPGAMLRQKARANPKDLRIVSVFARTLKCH